MIQSSQASAAVSPPLVSIVVPVFNEEGAVAGLAREIAVAFAAGPHEIIFVDDASTDGTCARLHALRGEFPQLRLIRHGRNAGQSRAVRTGVAAACADVVATLDGDGQNDPGDAPRLVRSLMASPHLAMVAGRRGRRRDSLAKRVGSRLANGVRRRVLNDDAEDTACGLKVFRREAFLQTPYFDHMHRFLPALFMREGFAVAFEDVGHRPRTSGASKYTNLGRLRASLLDLLGVMWLRMRMRDHGGAREV